MMAVAYTAHCFPPLLVSVQMVNTDWEDLQTLKWAQTMDPHQSEECELLLETYSMQVNLSHCPPLSRFPSRPPFLLLIPAMQKAIL